MDKENVIVLEKGTEFEKVIELKPIRGTKNLPKLSKLMTVVGDLEKKIKELNGFDESNLDGIVNLITYFWDNPDIINLLPFAFQMESEEDMAYLENDVTPLDVIFAFIQAAQYLAGAAFGTQEVSEALGKSDGAQEEVPVTKKAKAS